MLPSLGAVLKRFEVTIAEPEDLLALRPYRFAIIADDSGSMQDPSLPPRLLRDGSQRRPSEIGWGQIQSRTRWDELRQAVAEVAAIAGCFGSGGVDVHFLNRRPLLALGPADKRLEETFAELPLGGTPLTETLRGFTKSVQRDEPQLVFICTDGEPNFGRELFEKSLRRLLKKANVQVRIMAFTSDADVVGWLAGLEHRFPGVVFSDDYFEERQAVLRAQLAPRFTRGDWCAKAMLASVTEKYAAWDQLLHEQSNALRLTTSCQQCQIL